MMYFVCTPNYTPTMQRTANGDPWFAIEFERSKETIAAMTDEDAVKFAKQLGWVNPVLERIKHENLL